MREHTKDISDEEDQQTHGTEIADAGCASDARVVSHAVRLRIASRITFVCQ